MLMYVCSRLPKADMSVKAEVSPSHIIQQSQ